VSSERTRAHRQLKRTMCVGVLPRMRPDRALLARAALRRWGLTPAGAYGVGAVRHPERAAIIDELGTLTFAQVDRRTDAIACALHRLGVRAGDTAAIMCRNHRGIIEATVAASKLAANILYLDPESTPGALTHAIERGCPRLLIADEEFLGRPGPLGGAATRVLAWSEPGRTPKHPTLEQMAGGDGRAPAPAPGRARSVVAFAPPLEPVGEQERRALPGSLLVPGAARSQMPLRPREATMIAAPLCGRWGFLQLMLAMRLASTVVLRREFDPLETLAAVQEHDVSGLALLPEMLARMMALPRETIRWYPAALRVIAVMGGELPGEIAIPAMQRFGDVLYNLRGPMTVRLEGAWPRQSRESSPMPGAASAGPPTAAEATR
jgi:acyl-CoA synthetase (AMP-forming)/AMP-acid ligase II